MKTPKLKFIKNLNQVQKTEWGGVDKTVVFYDAYLTQIPGFKSWIQQFPFQIALKAGESLKSLKSYEQTVVKLQKWSLSKDTTFVAIGGGSVGDFVGFLASTYHRGKKLIQIPTTWLSAIDSAHGGKNGLNISGVKNQIGTFYAAEQIYFVQSILFFQKRPQVEDAFGEIFKIAIINKPQILKQVEISPSYIWDHLKSLVGAKYQVVHQDPHELTGYRQILNLGHTVGHFFEAHHKISHGRSVYFGLIFALRFSLQKGFIDTKDFYQIIKNLFLLESYKDYQKYLKVSRSTFEKYLSADKKKVSSNKLQFIFIKKLGHVVRSPVTLDEIYRELVRQQKEL